MWKWDMPPDFREIDVVERLRLLGNGFRCCLMGRDFVIDEAFGPLFKRTA